MVENRAKIDKTDLLLEQLASDVNNKARKVVKCSLSRAFVKILDVQLLPRNDKLTAFGIKINYRVRESDYQFTQVFDNKQLKDGAFAKRVVEAFIKVLPACTLQVSGVKEAVKDFLKNFSTLDKTSIKDTFFITKLPFRQLQLSSSGKDLDKFFIKLGGKSYQRLISSIDRLDWREDNLSIPFFDILQGALKRREIITLLLLLSTN